MNDIATTPDPPYYAVVFSSLQTDDIVGYSGMAERMEELAKLQPGYLGFESARDGIGIAVSYWRDIESIKRWKENAEHMAAQEIGRERWYAQYRIRICRVESEYSFFRKT